MQLHAWFKPSNASHIATFCVSSCLLSISMGPIKRCTNTDSSVWRTQGKEARGRGGLWLRRFPPFIILYVYTGISFITRRRTTWALPLFCLIELQASNLFVAFVWTTDVLQKNIYKVLDQWNWTYFEYWDLSCNKKQTILNQWHIKQTCHLEKIHVSIYPEEKVMYGPMYTMPHFFDSCQFVTLGRAEGVKPRPPLISQKSRQLFVAVSKTRLHIKIKIYHFIKQWILRSLHCRIK